MSDTAHASGAPTDSYTVHDVIRAGYTLEPLRCLNPDCPEPHSGNVTHNQHVGRFGDAYCSVCGLWQVESFGDEQGVPVDPPALWSVAVYRVERRYGGPEAGGWWYDAGERCDGPEFARLGWAEAEVYDDVAVARAREVQAVLDRDWNIGDHARLLDSVLSAGRWQARAQPGWPPARFPSKTPRYS